MAAESLTCARGHSFDIARQGYVTLSRPHLRRSAGDTSAMVAAREAFLAARHYRPIASVLAAAAAVGEGFGAGGPAERCVVDLGAGTGYHLSAVLDQCGRAWGIALDASRPALRRAARAHPRMAAVACDVWQELPLADASADLVINSFAPRNGAEINRVLRPGGVLIVVSPTPGHLHQLSSVPGMLGVDSRKSQRLRAQLPSGLSHQRTAELRFDMRLTRTELEALVMMGPSAHHVAPPELARHLDALEDRVTITASVMIETFSRAA